MEKLFFIAIVPPKEISEEITAFKQDFANRFESSRALKIIPHITLKSPFKVLGNEREILLDRFAGIGFGLGPFVMNLNGFGSFDNRKNPVVYVRPEYNRELETLQKLIVAEWTGWLPDQIMHTDRNFHPHLTIAYRDLSFENYGKAWTEYQSKQYRASFAVQGMELFEHDGLKWNIVGSKKL